MTTRLTFSRKVWLLAFISAGAMFIGQTASAQLAFVPRHVTVIAGPGSNFGGADTARSAELRGLGQLYQGQAQYMWGAGAYLQGVGQYQKDVQAGYSMSLDNRQKYLTLRAAHLRELEYDKQVRLIAARHKNEENRLARLRDHASAQSVSSGEALNFLWEVLGSRVETIPFQQLALTEQDLSAVRLRCPDGFTIDKLLQTLTAEGQVQWPATLRRDEFSGLRNAIEQSLAKVRELENKGQDARPHYQEAIRQTQSLEKLAGPKLAREGMAAWKGAREFCGDLRQTLTMASRGGLARTESVLSYQPKNAADLIQHMRHHNLRFAPTTDETGAAYQVLHTALAAAHQTASSGTKLASR